MRLGDLDALSEKMKGTNRYFDIKFDIDEMPTIDPETLSIVKELRAENKKLTEALGDSFAIDLMDRLDKVEKERDAAIEMLHGYCPACKNYIENHCEGPYEGCKHEYCVYDGYDAQDHWEWRGLKE